MKKTVIAAAAAMSVMAMMVSCGNKSCNGGNACTDGDKDKVEVYTGLTPGADVENIRYTLKLEYDHDDNYREGDYELLEQYCNADSTAVGGYKDVKSFTSEGDFTVMDKDGKKLLKLVQDVKDSQPGSSAQMYLIVVNDSTLALTNNALDSLTVSDNYLLHLAK